MVENDQFCCKDIPEENFFIQFGIYSEPLLGWYNMAGSPMPQTTGNMITIGTRPVLEDMYVLYNIPEL